MFALAELVDVVTLRLRVGLSIRAAGERRGLSLRAFAVRIAVSPGTLSALENGATTLSVDRLLHIAEELEVSPQQLLEPFAGPGDGRTSERELVPTGEDWRRFDELTVDPALRGALLAFCKKGFHGASIREIAQESGLSVPGLYHYHPSKQAMLAALLDLTMADLTWRVEAARTGVESADERLRITVECLALFHARRPGPAFLGASEMRSLEPTDRVRIVQYRKRIQQLLYADLDVLLVDAPDARRRSVVLGNAISTMCTSVAQWFDPSGEADAELLARLYAEAAVAMAVPPSKPSSPSRKAHR